MPQTKPGIATTILAPDPVGEGFVEITPNKTLIAQKLTQNDPVKPELAADLKTIDDVFTHYQPRCTVELAKENGTTVQEEFHFGSLGDFAVKNLVANSALLKKISLENDAFIKIRKQLGSNKSLKNVLENPGTKSALINALMALSTELEEG